MKGFPDIPSSPTTCDCMHEWMYHPLSGDLSTTFQGGSAQLSQRSHILKTTQNKVQLQSRSWCSHRSALHPCHPKVAPAPLSPVISKELLSAKPESPAKHKHRSEDCLYQPAPLAKAKVAQSAVSGVGIKRLDPLSSCPYIPLAHGHVQHQSHKGDSCVAMLLRVVRGSVPTREPLMHKPGVWGFFFEVQPPLFQVCFSPNGPPKPRKFICSFLPTP